MLAAAEDVLATEAKVRANGGRSLWNLPDRREAASVTLEIATTGAGYEVTSELAATNASHGEPFEICPASADDGGWNAEAPVVFLDWTGRDKWSVG
ncbi:hypothetical protein DVH05_007383 [Phytophthora capsici]|nr:hypothetical protein DVH05_007383 [Phytophthora capsici]